MRETDLAPPVTPPVLAPPPSAAALPTAAPAPLAATVERQAAPLLDTPLPQNLEAEKAVLGSMLLDAAAAATCARMLRAQDFMDPARQKLFGFLAEHREPDERADLVALEASLNAVGLLEEIGGRAFLLGLSDAVPIFANAPIYCRLVRHAAAQRAAVQAGLELARQAGRPQADVPGLLKSLAQRMQRVVEPEDTIGKPLTASALVAQFPHLRPEVIAGVVRRGEVGTLAAASKMFKSWLLMYVGLCVATGRSVFDRFPTRQGPVLLVDYELSPGTLAKRLLNVAEEMGVDLDALAGTFCVVSLRGRRLDIDGLGNYLEALGRDFDLIIVDPLYRTYPPEFDENSNGDMAALFGHFQRIAENLNAALLICHHLSKGPQGDKYVVDLGSGAGAQARAVDALIGLRHHATEGAAVVSGVVRSFPPFDDFVIRWECPLWRSDPDLDPTDLRRTTRRPRPPKTPAAPPELAPPSWTVDRFAGEILTETPQTRAAVLDAAIRAGVRNAHQAERLLELAEATGKGFRWRLPKDKRTFYAAQPQPALTGGTP